MLYEGGAKEIWQIDEAIYGVPKFQLPASLSNDVADVEIACLTLACRSPQARGKGIGESLIELTAQAGEGGDVAVGVAPGAAQRAGSSIEGPAYGGSPPDPSMI